MSPGSVAAKALHDRTRLAVGCGAGLGAFAVFGAWMYDVLVAGEDDTNLFDDLPAAFEGLIGAGGSGNYVAAEIFGLIAPVLILVVAISGAAAVLAGEEHRRTAEVLLTQPVTRREVVLGKSGVLVLHVVVVAACYLVGMTLGQALFGYDLSYGGIALSAVQLVALALAFGMITLAVANTTGSKPVSIAVGSTLAVAANLVAGLFPLVDGLEGLAELSPWYYFNGGDPLSGDVRIGHLAVLVTIAVAGFALGLVAVDHRDIRSGPARVGITIPAIRSVTRPRVGGLFSKALSDRTTMIAVAGLALALMSIAMSAMFIGMENTLTELSDSMPESFEGMIGSVDIASPTGWMTAEMLSLLAPIVVIAVAVVIAVNGVAGEDEDRTLGLLAAAPVERSRIVLSQTAVMLIAVAVICGMTGIGFAVGSPIGGLDLTTSGIAGAITHLAMLAIFFGAVGGAIGAIGAKRTATTATAIVAIVTWLANWLFGLSDSTDWLTAFSPWHYYITSDPLVNGVEVRDVLTLAVGSVTAMAAAVPLFERREITT